MNATKEATVIQIYPKLTSDQVRDLGLIAESASDLYAAMMGSKPIWENRDHMRMFFSQFIRERASLMHLKVEEQE